MPQPSEFRITQEHRATADNLTRFYGDILAQRRERRPYSPEQEGRQERERVRLIGEEIAGRTPLQDVTAQVDAFAEDLRFAEEVGGPIPMANVEEVGPVPILIGAQWIDAPDPWFFGRRGYDFWLRSIAKRAWPAESGFTFETAGIAHEGFLRGLRGFLVQRVAGFEYWQRNRVEQSDEEGGTSRVFNGGGGKAPFGPPPGGTPPTGSSANHGGLVVTLSCTNHYLRAQASTALSIQWHQFGAPTTPVTGILQPGLWLFAADGGVFGTTRVVDPVPARIPPTLTPCATPYF